MKLSFYMNLFMGLSFILLPDTSLLVPEMTDGPRTYVLFSLYKNPPVFFFAFLSFLLFCVSFFLLYLLVRLTPANIDPVWSCPACGNENAFDHIQCWKCHTPKPPPEPSPESQF